MDETKDSKQSDNKRSNVEVDILKCIETSRYGLNISQIAKELKLHRNTQFKYINFSYSYKQLHNRKIIIKSFNNKGDYFSSMCMGSGRSPIYDRFCGRDFQIYRK